MPFNTFKEIKVKCGHCGTIIVSKSESEWTVCPCEKTKVMGMSFKRIQGDKYTDLTVWNFSEIPEHRGWDDKREDYYKNEGTK